MTFSQEVKSEVLKSVKNIKGCCARSFLTAVLKAIGSLTLEYKKFYFTVESDNHDFLVMCKDLANRHLSCNAQIESRNVNVKGVAVYSCNFEDNLGDKLFLTSHADNTFALLDNVDSVIPQNECCKKAFMQGLFLSSGSVVIPVGDIYDEENKNTAKYHLELRFSDMAFACAVQNSYSALDLKLLERKNHIVLYLKDSEKIADFLAYIYATHSRLKLDNIIAGRSMRNKINRQNNCSVANIDKTVAAAQNQLHAIRVLKQKGLYNSLTQQLKDVADMREAYPEATLDEIAAKLQISKSGANHRFAKLIELANTAL